MWLEHTLAKCIAHLFFSNWFSYFPTNEIIISQVPWEDLGNCRHIIDFAPICSVVQEQQARAHNHPESTYPLNGRWVCLHRLHSYHTVCGYKWDPTHCPIGGDSNLAPPGWQMANCSLPQIWSTFGFTTVSQSQPMLISIIASLGTQVEVYNIGVSI